jgi:hypothetical protein
MATQFNFNGRLIKLPGTYTQIKSGVTNPTLDFSYGNVLVIDNNVQNTFGGGSGINGESKQGQDSVYGFDNLPDFRAFVAGGEMWDNAKPLFRPFGSGSLGISTLWYVRGLSTIAASASLVWTNGSLTFKTQHEGLVGNGVEGDEVLAKQTVTVTAVGVITDTIKVTVDGVILSTYTSNGTDTPAVAASVIANDINNSGSGYTASVLGAVVTVFAIAGTGSGANSDTFVSAVTGTATSTVGGATLLGGLDGTSLSQGFAITMESGSVNTAKFKLKFWRGTYTGVDELGKSYDGLAADVVTPTLIAISPEFNTIQEVIDWTAIDYDFNNAFRLTASVGTGAVITADMTATTGNQLFSGGSQTHNAADMTAALDAVTGLDYTHILSLDSGANALSADNLSLAYHLDNQAKYEKFLVIGGGEDKNTFTTQSIVAAQTLNSKRVVLVHGGCYENDRTEGTGLRRKNAVYKAAYVLGRTAGLEPQTPPTFKGLGYAGEVHKMTDTERTTALDEGVLTTYFDSEIGAIVITQGINTLQLNRYVVNEDGSSHSWQLMRIAAQLNKEIEINAKVQLLGNQSQGPNRATLSPEVVVQWVKGYLKRKTATSTQDNLILSFQDVTVEIKQDAYCINYAFVPNFEVNKLFFTGLILDPNL